MKKTIFVIFVILVVSLIGISTYKQLNKKSAKASRLDCHKEVVVFERVYANDKLEELQKLIKTGEIKYDFKIEKAKYMESKLFEFVDANKTSDEVLHILGLKNYDKSDLELKVLLYENDKLDPGKKSAEAKLYAGYLMFDFYISAIPIYKIQIDFMDLQGKDIAKRVECVKQSTQTVQNLLNGGTK